MNNTTPFICVINNKTSTKYDEGQCIVGNIAAFLYKYDFGYFCIGFLGLIAILSIFGGIKQNYRWFILNQCIWDIITSTKKVISKKQNVPKLLHATVNRSIANNDVLDLQNPESNNEPPSKESPSPTRINILKFARSKAIVRCAKRNPKAWTQLCTEERIRRLRKIERIAPGAHISSATEEFVMSPESSLDMAVTYSLTTRQVAGIRKVTKKVASNYSIAKAKKQILNDYGSQIDVQTSSQNPIKTFTFDQTFLKFVESTDPEFLSSLQTIVVSADSGGDVVTVTKVGWYPCDVENPCSEKSFRILSSFEDKEYYEYVKAVLLVVLSHLPQWKQGCFVNYFFIRVKAIITGDLKFLNSYNGLQGCQATCFCPICIIKKSELIQRKRDAPVRTLAQLHEDYEKLQGLLQSARTIKAIAKAHQGCHSIKNQPMTDHFDVSHMCPGVCHTLAGALNSICDWAKKFNKEKIEQFFKDAGVYPQGHTKKLTGNHGRILLNKLSNGDITYDRKGFTLLLLLADIQQYAVARILSDEEITELLMCINIFANEFSKSEYDDIAKSSQHIHMIIVHVGPFVVLHRSWGLFSDQPGEAIHKTQNKFYKRIPKRSTNANSTKKSVNRNDYFVGNTILQNKFNDNKR